MDRFEHLDDMSDRPTLGQGSGEEIERGANGGSGDGGGTRGARSPQDGAGDRYVFCDGLSLCYRLGDAGVMGWCTVQQGAGMRRKELIFV